MSTENSKKGIVIAIASGVAAVAITLGGAFAAIKMGYIDINGSSPAEAEKPEPIVVVEPIYIKIPPFTVNIIPDELSPRIISKLFYVGLSYRVENKETEDFLVKHMPELRSRLLMAMSEQDPTKIMTKEGKEAVKARLMQIAQEPFVTPQPELKISDVLFNEFIIQ